MNGLPDGAPLRPATADEIEPSLVFALRFNGRKRVHQGDEFMAKITAERLVEHLEWNANAPPTSMRTTSG